MRPCWGSIFLYSWISSISSGEASGMSVCRWGGDASNSIVDRSRSSGFVPFGVYSYRNQWIFSSAAVCLSASQPWEAVFFLTSIVQRSLAVEVGMRRNQWWRTLSSGVETSAPLYLEICWEEGQWPNWYHSGVLSNILVLVCVEEKSRWQTGR